MKLSIVAPIYKDTKILDKFLWEMQRQELQSFELILVIDTNLQNGLEVVDKYKDFFQERLGIIYNTKRSGRTVAIQQGVTKASGQYIWIASTSDIFLKDGTKELIQLINVQKTDIIEFRARMRSPIRFRGLIRKNYPKSTIIKDNPAVIAYTFPFDFNKLFTRDVLLKALENEQVHTINSRFAMGYVLKSFYFATTYSNVSKKIIRSKLSHINEVAPLSIAKQWEDIREYIITKQNNQYSSEFDYLSYYHEVVILTGFVGVLHRKNLTEKYRKYLEKQIDQYYRDKIDNNKYFLLDNPETKAFRSAKNFADYLRLFRALN